MAVTPWLSLKVNPSGAADLNKFLGRVHRWAEAPFESKGLGAEIRDAFITRVNDAFRSSGSTVGGWAPLSGPYL